MRRANRLFTVQTVLLVLYVGLVFGQRDKFLGGLIDFLNNLPNQPYVYEDGLLLSSHSAGENLYELEVSLKASDVQDPKSFKLLRCTATVQDNGEAGVTVLDHGHQCHEDVVRPAQTQGASGPDEGVEEGTEAPLQELPVKLDNEVQSDTAVTSGEQFVAIPRHIPDSPCIGCSSRVNPKAPGVHELALLGVRHLDRHDPTVRHTLEGVLEVERQVQVVNGVRYILTLKVSYDNCTIAKTDECSADRTCKISILEKPWVKLPDGSKFRAILANNCTENWLFGDDGEVLPPEKNNVDSISNRDKHEHESDDDFVKAVYQTDTQYKPPTERTLSENDVKLLEDQIIPRDQQNAVEVRVPSIKVTTEPNTVQQEQNSKDQNVIVSQKTTLNDITYGQEEQLKKEVVGTVSTLSNEKKKDIDDLLGFLNYANLEPKSDEKDHTPRMRRSFDRDLKLLDLAETYKKIKSQVADGRTMVSLGEFLVKYLNEMDIEMKTHVLQDILKAEEESDDDRQFVYIQARVYIPCGKLGCDSNENVTNICNAVIDNTEFRSPQIVNSFCYEENINKRFQGKVTTIPLDDPVLRKLVIDVLKKMENESDLPNALNLRVLEASTRKTVGIVTEMSIESVYTNCNKTIPLSLRDNCIALENVGSHICEVVIVDRSWLNEKQISYTCTKRSVDESMSTEQNKAFAGNMKNPKLLSMAQLALQHLEEHSNIDYRQKVIDIRKVSTQLVAGLLTNLEFVVGYTSCLHSDPEFHPEDCRLYDGLPLRNCKAQIWDRSWLIDGKQVKVSCDDTSKFTNDLNNNEINRKKRYIREDIEQGLNKEVARQTPGGIVELDANDPKYLTLAKKSLQNVAGEIKLSGVWKVVKVNKVTRQVVEGTVTNIDFTIANDKGISLPCHSKITVQSWLKKKDIKVTCKKLTKLPESFSVRQKKHSQNSNNQVVADASPKDGTFYKIQVQVNNPNDPKYQKMTEDSLQKYVTETKLSGVWKVAKIITVAVQLQSGSGEETVIDFTISNSEGVSLPCRTHIWDHLNIKKRDIIVNCNGTRNTDVMNLATQALENYLSQSNLLGKYTLNDVKKVWNLSRNLILIDFSVTDDKGAVIDCHAKTKQRKWSNQNHFKVHCSPVKNTHDKVTGTQNMIGGIKQQDPKDPRYRKLAEDALQKYVTENKLSGVWKVATVNSVTDQVVEGSLTRINFTISGNTGSESLSLPCYSEIWDRPWLHKKDIKVNCQKLKIKNLRRHVRIENPAIENGSEQQQNPNEKKYEQLAKEALYKYFKQSCCSTGEVTRVLHVTTALESRLKINIDFEVLRNDSLILICHALVLERAWQDDQKMDITCAETRRLAGTFVLNGSDPSYFKLAQKTLGYYYTEVPKLMKEGKWNTTDITLVLNTIDPVKWLSGSMIELHFKANNTGNNYGKILSCVATAWYMPWLQQNDTIGIECGLDARRNLNEESGPEYQVSHLEEQDPNNPKYVNLAKQALNKYVQHSGTKSELIKITYVMTQVLNGIRTTMYFLINQNNSRNLICKTKVIEQEWLKNKKMDVRCDKTDEEISKVKKYNPVVEGQINKDPKNPEYRVLAQKSLQKHLSQKGLAGVWEVAAVTKVTCHVASNSSTQIDFIVVENGGQVLSCYSEVLEQPIEEIIVDCKKIVRQKGIDSIEAKDPNDPKYHVLAEKSLKKYLSQLGMSGDIAEVTNVTEQVIEGYRVVSGSLIVIDFTGVETNGQRISCHSIVWDRPWLSDPEITVDCENVARRKRQLPGGVHNKNPKEYTYQVLAEESLQKHVLQNGLAGVWKVTEVTRVTEQVVAGLLTEIDFNIAESGLEVLFCHSEILEQPWLSVKDIQVNCSEVVREKREILVGGQTEKDPKDPKYQVLAEKSLQKYVSQKGLAGVWKVAEVTKVTSQVVSGSLTRINFTIVENSGQLLSCHSKVWEQPWLNKEEITVDCEEAGRRKRALIGGAHEKDPKDPNYRVLAEKSLQKHVAAKGLAGVWKVAEVTKVTSQVVSGSLTRLNFTIVENSGKLLFCHSKVWEQPWLNKEEITVDCEEAGRRKRGLDGGANEKDPKDPKYRVLAEKSLQKHVSQKGLAGVWKVAEVTKVTYQVVSGSLTKIDFTVLENSGQHLSCHSEVLQQPWLNREEITVDCEEAGRRKRALIGGAHEKDPKDPNYRVLAEKSLQKHVAANGLAGVWKVAEVTKVTYQVVSGSLTRLNFTIEENSGKLVSCYSEVWDQPWLNKEEITVDCEEAGRQKRGLDGGANEKDPKDPKYRVLAEKSLQKHVSQKGLTGVWKVAEVTKVTYQVVSGSLTKIDFTVIENSGQHLSCHSEVWQQPWLKKEEITIDCEEAGRQKRALIGGAHEKDPKDPNYRVLAEKSLQKHVAANGLAGVWKVAEVTKVTYQVVSGSLTRLNFTIEENSGKLVSCYSEVWDQPWLNKEEITVDCEEAGRQKRGLDGGANEKDPKDPKYRVLAEKSLQKHVSHKGLAGVWKVAEVTKVTYQVVSGSLTKIDFTVIENSGQHLSCHSEVWQQPWLKKEEITIDCEEAGRQKRALIGGAHEKDPKDPNYRVLAEKSLQKHVSEKGLAGVWKVAEVTKVTYQVVSGSLTRLNFTIEENSGKLLSCYSEVWDQPWLNKEEITVDCEEAGRQKRGLDGGANEKDPKDPKYRVLAEKSLQKHVSQKGLAGVWKVAEVTKVTYQVVSGSLTKIDFTVIENSGQHLSCHSEVWQQPWLKKEEITIDCEEAGRQKRALIGGAHEKDPKDPNYRVLAEKSLQKHVSEKGLAGVWKVAEVTKVTYQVVSGSLTRLYFTIEENSGKLLSCYSKVWDQPWLNKEEITVDCEEAGRQKRALIGGANEKDPKDPSYRVLAEKSLQKHVSQKGLAGVWKVAEVTKVTYQVVSGSLTKMDFTVVENSGQHLSCHSEVWEQPWLNKEEITVDCKEAERRKRARDGDNEEKDPKDQKYYIFAEKSLQKHVLQQHLSGVWKVVEVTKVTYQAISGSLIQITNLSFTCVENSGHLLSCHSTVREQPWLNKEDISVDCKENVVQKQDVNEIEHRRLAQEAVFRYDRDYNSKYFHKVLKVSHVYTYNITENVTVIDFTVAKTKCLRIDEDFIKPDCEIDSPVNPTICRTVVENENNTQQFIYTHCADKKAKEMQKKKYVSNDWLSKNKRIKKSTEKSSILAPPTTSDARFKRQIRPDAYEIDDDVKFLYAEKAIDDLNLRSDTHNMQKLVAIHSTATSMQMGTQLVRMYIEVSYTYCLKQSKPTDMSYCDELDGLNHRLCLVKVYPAPQDDTIINHVTSVCDDEQDFESSSGINVVELIKASINYIEQKEKLHYKLVHQGEPNIVPSLDTSEPIKLSFIVVTTNCSKSDISDIYDYGRMSSRRSDCVVLESIHPKACSSFIWMSDKIIKHIKSVCRPIEPAARSKRSTDSGNKKNSSATVEQLVNESIHKLEMSNIYKFKQRILQINSFNTKITTGRLTTIDFDVGYTSCLKFEWVDDIAKCEFLEHLPRRHCVSMVYERLWVSNGRKIHVTCEDDETPLEVHTEFENAQLATNLAEEALKHIEFKYPHTQRQKVVRVFSVEKQSVAGLHYRLKLEVGFTDCAALSVSADCNLAPALGDNKFCRANIWVRPWTDHPPTVRVVCDYQEAATSELYHQVQAEHLFYVFVTTHRPKYMDDPVKMAERFQIFKANVRRIHELNTREKGTARYAVTQYADLSYEEFSKQYLGLKPGLRDGNQLPRAPARIPSYEIPASFDWREHGAVTPVKNQGSCGSCWAFSVTGNVEGQYKLHTGKLLSLSEQELVDCDKLDQGCNGGMPDNAYRAIEAMGGLETEDDYPYEGENDKCTFNKTMAKVQLSGAVNISSNETDMAKWLVQNGPISIGINANAMQFYVGGVSHPWKMLCNPNNIDHGVLIVGYGVKNYPLFNKVLPYWIVKNSWGASWGEQGYYRVFRGDGTCGVNTLASSAILALPNEF